jgi:cell division protein FtsQ
VFLAGGFRLIVEVGGSSAALLGRRMMKMGTQRGVSAAAVLDAPEMGYSPEPAPAGALQRGRAADPAEPFGYRPEADEEEYRPRRGKLRPSFRSLLRSKGGRIVLASLGVIALVAVLVGLAAVRTYLLRDPRFFISGSEDIQTSGNVHLSRAQVLGVFGSDLERNVFRVSLAERQADLERLPWVQHATVMRLLPNQLKVQIVERTPVAFARQGTSIGLVDASGVLLDMSEDVAADAKYSFPVLTGISAADPLSTRAARMALYLKFMKDLDGSGQNYSKTVSEADVTDPDDLKALISGAGGREVLVHFGDEKFLTRYNQFEKLLPTWLQQYPKLASADMRYQGQIVLEMQKGGETAAAASALSAAAKGADFSGADSVAAKNSTLVDPKPFLAVAKPIPVATKAVAAKKVAAKKVAPPTKAKPAVVKAKVAAPKKPAKPVAKKVAGKPGKVVAKPAVAHTPRGQSAANEKVFAALAAQRKAQK